MVNFFLEGVYTTAQSAIDISEKITKIREQDMRKIQQLGKPAAATGVEVLRRLYAQPIIGVADIADWIKYTRQGAYRVIDRFLKLDILKPLPLRGTSKYAQKYIYWEFFNLFNEGDGQ